MFLPMPRLPFNNRQLRPFTHLSEFGVYGTFGSPLDQWSHPFAGFLASSQSLFADQRMLKHTCLTRRESSLIISRVWSLPMVTSWFY